MKIILRYIYLIAFACISFYTISSCNKESPTTPSDSEMGILKTDEFGNILGGDYSDWCIHNPVDTFTTIKYFYVTMPQNNISFLKWATSKEYNCYGFDIERRIIPDTNFIKIGFVNGAGTTNDSVAYVYFDTLQPNHPSYSYRLKQLDIYGNYTYISSGIQNIYPIQNASFGPAYPNPTTGNFVITFSIPRKDTVSIFFTEFRIDTTFFAKNEILNAGTYEFHTSNNSNFHNVQKRLFIKSSTIRNADSCSLYGDIQFN